MNKPARLITLIILIALAPPLTATSLRAADLGVQGTIWPITEPNLLDSIKAELGTAETDGRLAAFNNSVQNQSKDAFDGRGYLSLGRAHEPRSWVIDPSITLNQDIRTHTGQLVAAKGTRVNPLERLGLDRNLLFIDARDEEQLIWALAEADNAGKQGLLTPKIILTGGQPAKLMEIYERRFWFDQKGILVARFGISALPARISQKGLMLQGEEIWLAGKTNKLKGAK